MALGPGLQFLCMLLLSNRMTLTFGTFALVTRVCMVGATMFRLLVTKGRGLSPRHVVWNRLRFGLNEKDFLWVGPFPVTPQHESKLTKRLRCMKLQAPMVCLRWVSY